MAKSSNNVIGNEVFVRERQRQQQDDAGAKATGARFEPITSC
ncbi:hypothetical protein [Nostoc punctiforme]